MKAVFENNMERGRGYARLRLSEVADFSSGGWRFSLCRASDTTYLGRSGWQNSEDFTEPETYATEGNTLILHIGPDVVNKLDPNENYRITLQSDSQSSQKATFAITTLNRTLMDDQGRLAGAAKATVLPVPPAQPDPGPEPMPEAPAPVVSSPVPEAPKKSRLPMILAALLVLALFGGGLAFWFIKRGAPDAAPPEPVKQEKKQEEKPEPAKTDPPEPVKPEAKPEPTKTDPPEPGKQEEKIEPAKDVSPAPLSTRTQANTYLRGNPTAQGARELAAMLQQSSTEDQDAVYRLWYFAADAGDVAACLHLAQTVDPSRPAWGSILKNGAEAWSLYAKVAPQQPDAANALHALKQWMEQEAAKGNKEAIGWIRKITEDAAKK